jgi:hypothetical protein
MAFEHDDLELPNATIAEQTRELAAVSRPGKAPGSAHGLQMAHDRPQRHDHAGLPSTHPAAIQPEPGGRQAEGRGLAQTERFRTQELLPSAHRADACM